MLEAAGGQSAGAQFFFSKHLSRMITFCPGPQFWLTQLIKNDLGIAIVVIAMYYSKIRFNR